MFKQFIFENDNQCRVCIHVEGDQVEVVAHVK